MYLFLARLMVSGDIWVRPVSGRQHANAASEASKTAAMTEPPKLEQL